MPDSQKISILVVDDHFMVRIGLCASLNVEPDMKVVAEAGNGEEALRAYHQHRPELVLMDVRLPGMSGIETTAAILREFPDAHILMLSTHAGEEEIYRSLQTGAAGYILKSAVREQLLQAIRQVCRGERYIDPSVTSLLAARMSHRSLTSRELEVLRMVVKGLSNKEIAAALNIAEVTVKLHVSHVLEKLNVKDRTHAATEALKRGIIYVLLLVSPVGRAGWAAGQASPLPVLTSVEQLRRLTPDQAQLGYPVRIRGVITDDIPKPDFFVQDVTAGIYVEGSAALASSHVLGNFVEVEGVTGPGRFAPVIRERKLRVLGRKPLPRSRIYAFHELSDGQKDSQWVQVRGIVRSVSIDRTSWRETTLAMNVSSGGSQFTVRTPLGGPPDISFWIDKEVLIQGVCGTLFNAERQLVGILFYVPRLEFIRLEPPSDEVPFAALMRFSPEPRVGHKVRVRGIVAYQQAGNILFLENAGKGLRVLAQQDTPVRVGDIVDALGFPSVGESEPVLADAVFRVIGNGPAPEPIDLELNSSWGRYDAALVRTEARLIHMETQPSGASLLLQRGTKVFEARLESPDAHDLQASLPPGSDLLISGICLVRAGGMWRAPESFRLLLRSRSDITILRRPSWWNLRHTVWVLVVTATVLLLVIAWVVALGRRLREQMALIRQKLRGNAVLEERNRIARELHDTLEQELAGITMQLDLAADCFHGSPGVAREAIEMARNMSRHSMLEARRSVWDLRCQWLENGSLVSALTQAIQPMAVSDQAQIQVQIQGEPYRLEPQVEMNLLRIGQEAVTNALRHAGARTIIVELRYESESLQLSVIDDGRGFSPGNSTFAAGGHFGLLDMRERAQSLGCHLQIDSRPGSGTRVCVAVSTQQSAVSTQPASIVAEGLQHLR